MAEKQFKYHYLKYNHYGVLRPNWLMKLGVIFLCRHFVFLLALLAMNFKGGTKPGTDYLMTLVDKTYIITDFPAFALLFALGARRPDSKPAMRWVWRNGRYLIFASIVMFLGLLAIRTRMDLSLLGYVEWAMIAGNFALAAYIARSEYIRDLFNEFPEPRELKTEPSEGEESGA